MVAKNINKKIEEAHKIILMTSGQCLIFNEKGEQIPELQSFFSKGHKNVATLKKISENCKEHSIAKFRGFIQDLTKEEFLTITNLI